MHVLYNSVKFDLSPDIHKVHCYRHLECVTYLLSKGADVMATNSKGETCLHIAAKNGHSGCIVRLLSSRINTPGAATRLADLVFAEGLEEVKYVDLHNLAGMTALHVAALNGSSATVQAVLASGASVDAQITATNLTPWLSRGSTALHIAAARGFHAVVDVLLASQSPESGTSPSTDSQVGADLKSSNQRCRHIFSITI